MSVSYSAVKLTLTAGSTNYNLATLARAIDADVPGECRHLVIEADASNAAGSQVSVGDVNMSGTRYGYQLGPGDSRVYEDAQGLIRLSQINLRGSTTNLQVNVEVMR